VSWSSNGKINSQGTSEYTDTPQVGYGEEESKAQIKEAQAVVKILVDSKVMGEGGFLVTLNGHANPGGEPVENWSLDYIQIQIHMARS